MPLLAQEKAAIGAHFKKLIEQKVEQHIADHTPEGATLLPTQRKNMRTEALRELFVSEDHGVTGAIVGQIQRGRWTEEQPEPFHSVAAALGYQLTGEGANAEWRRLLQEAGAPERPGGIKDVDFTALPTSGTGKSFGEPLTTEEMDEYQRAIDALKAQGPDRTKRTPRRKGEPRTYTDHSRD